jgi:hypothetical protein
MKNLITLFVITFLSISLVAQTEKWQEMESFKSKIAATNYLTKENIVAHFEEAKQIHANSIANATGNDLDMINTCYAFSLVTISNFYLNVNDLFNEDLNKERFVALAYLEEVSKRAPIKFEKNGKKVQYSKIIIDTNLGLLNYYAAANEKKTMDAVSYLNKAIAIVTPYKKESSSNYLTFKYEKFKKLYYLEEDYSEEGINAALDYLNQYYELKSEKESNFLIAKGFIFDYLTFALEDYYDAETIQNIVKLPNALVEDKIALLYDVSLMTPNKIQSSRELLKLYYAANAVIQKDKKYEATAAANELTLHYNEYTPTELSTIAEQLYSYGNYENAAKFYTEMVSKNKAISLNEINNIIMLKKLKLNNNANLATNNFSIIDANMPAILAQKEAFSKNMQCNELKAFATDFVLTNNTQKQKEYNKKAEQCEAAIAKAEKNRQKEAEKSSKKRKLKNSNTGVYVGVLPFEFQKSNTKKPGYGGHIIFKGQKSALELGYINVVQKQNQFNYLASAKESNKDAYTSLWKGYRALASIRKYTENTSFGGLKLMYSDRNLLPKTVAVKNLTTNVTSNLVFDNIVEKQYTALIIMGMTVPVSGPLAFDFAFGFGGSYSQFDGGRPEYNNATKFSIPVGLLTSKPTYFSPQIDVKISVGLNFKTVKK